MAHLLEDDTTVKVLRAALAFYSEHFAELLVEDSERGVVTIVNITSPVFEFVRCWLLTGGLPPLGLRVS